MWERKLRRKLWTTLNVSAALLGPQLRSLVKSYGLKFRARPWNEVMQDDGTWATPTLGTTGLTKYYSADLNLLKTR